MPLTKTKKSEIVSKNARGPGDTGGSPVQIALLTERIQQISSHLKSHAKDHAGRLGLLKLVGQRRRLLRYFQRMDPKGHQALLAKLDLRK